MQMNYDDMSVGDLRRDIEITWFVFRRIPNLHGCVNFMSVATNHKFIMQSVRRFPMATVEEKAQCFKFWQGYFQWLQVVDASLDSIDMKRMVLYIIGDFFNFLVKECEVTRWTDAKLREDVDVRINEVVEYFFKKSKRSQDLVVLNSLLKMSNQDAFNQRVIECSLKPPTTVTVHDWYNLDMRTIDAQLFIPNSREFSDIFGIYE